MGISLGGLPLPGRRHPGLGRRPDIAGRVAADRLPLQPARPRRQRARLVPHHPARGRVARPGALPLQRRPDHPGLAGGRADLPVRALRCPRGGAIRGLAVAHDQPSRGVRRPDPLLPRLLRRHRHRPVGRGQADGPPRPAALHPRAIGRRPGRQRLPAAAGPARLHLRPRAGRPAQLRRHRAVRPGGGQPAVGRVAGQPAAAGDAPAVGLPGRDRLLHPAGGHGTDAGALVRRATPDAAAAHLAAPSGLPGDGAWPWPVSSTSPAPYRPSMRYCWSPCW